MRCNYFFSLLLILSLSIVQPFCLNAQVPVNATSKDFKVKGFHLDLRIQVMTPKALKKFVKELSEFGMNTLVMEYEATYPFEKHATIANELSYTRGEIQDFVAYCDGLGIKVIPLQQSLGHVEYILRNPRYSDLKEDRKDISQLCPMKTEESKKLFTELFSDMAQMHNSDYIHIGGDETRLLGHCPLCAKKVEEEGKSKLFVDYMTMMADIVVSLGKKPVMWADIILKHPEAAKELPKETIFVDWNYGWRINHFGDVPGLQELGFTFWGAPAIRSHPDNWYVTDWKTHFKNQKDFIPYSRTAGYEGMIMTSWSTSGVYGFNWDVNYDVVDMVQLRNTYPLSAFRISIASYAQALKTKEPIHPEKFILDYGKNHFGLSDVNAQQLLAFLYASPELIVNGKPTKSKNIAEMKANFALVRNQLNNIKPKQNKEEFAHFKLMADLRMHYLDFKEVNSEYNSTDFSVDQTPELLKKLDQILKEGKELGKRFYDLNEDFIYDSELKEQNELRIEPITVLYNRLAKLK